MSSFGAPGPVEIYSRVQWLQSLYVTVVESRVVLAHTPKINLICLGVWPQSTNVTDSQMDRPTDDLQWHRPDVESRPNREKATKKMKMQKLIQDWGLYGCMQNAHVWDVLLLNEITSLVVISMGTGYVTYLRHQLRHQSRGRQAASWLPGSRNRYSLIVIPICIRYNNTNEEN